MPDTKIPEPGSQIKTPWVRFFPSDFIAGTRGLSSSETGVYIMLICMMYESGDGWIEDDRQRLRHYCNAPNRHFNDTIDMLIRYGKLISENGRLTNSRVQEERSWTSKRSAKGAELAKLRWEKNETKTTADKSDAHSCSNANQNQNQNTTSLRSVDKARKRAERLPSDWKIPDDWMCWAIDLGISESDAISESRKMLDWSLSSPKGKKLDWHATWRNWIRRRVEERKTSKANGMSSWDRAQAFIDQLPESGEKYS